MLKFKDIGKAQLMLSFFILIVLYGCKKSDKSIDISGFTMGTTYSIKIIDDEAVSINTTTLQQQIDSVLVSINQQMSTYIADSEISLFNAKKNNDWQFISTEFYQVIEFSKFISQITKGTFDITVAPLVDIWGFGTSNQSDWRPPTKDNINSIIKYVGYNNIECKDNQIRKLNPSTIIDLNAVAKGFGVDAVFDYLYQLGYTRILVEIGGEIRGLGKNQMGKPWTIGIDQPMLDVIPGSNLQEIIELDNRALATSGDYRNYFYYNDKLYSHTINPLTGYPIEDGISSASVLAPNCMMADALATALMVMGRDGIELIENIDNVEVLLVKRVNDREFTTIKSSGWSKN